MPVSPLCLLQQDPPLILLCIRKGVTPVTENTAEWTRRLMLIFPPGRPNIKNTPLRYMLHQHSCSVRSTKLPVKNNREIYEYTIQYYSSSPSLHTQVLNEAKRINPRCCCTCCASRWIGLPRRKIVCADLVIVVGVVTRLVRGRGVTPLVRGRGHHDLLIFAGRARKYLFSCT